MRDSTKKRISRLKKILRAKVEGLQLTAMEVKTLKSLVDQAIASSDKERVIDILSEKLGDKELKKKIVAAKTLRQQMALLAKQKKQIAVRDAEIALDKLHDIIDFQEVEETLSRLKEGGGRSEKEDK